ncbi:geranylgeranylglyceryl/heptaprenylglyceryl phosphate synthase [Brumimicrobium salinarum]|uniref:Geranylgeranylglyceryl phosphate synthase n=1 Tax=Brumimicrobium salinarum TaxID=2058658 RepID=A0A2I0R763_9FLAO|nr:geranylgeranylglyceryl/heptaprenylglyceryl phosphate synthase [Brumimicrobium salinarum]PKR82240.1 geranylgeranylglyceryl/heptaprenylglyceryl phosphate synthase [Brumimicrobium salinarum]
MKLNNNIYNRFQSKIGQIAVLIDPEKTNTRTEISNLVKKSEFAKIDYFFVGGSTVTRKDFRKTIAILKTLTSIPLVIFPGDHQQISDEADALLYLSLLSGRNPEYLIGQHVKSAQEVLQLNIEVIPTAYILIDGGNQSTVAYVSQTRPIPRDNTTIALNTAIAGSLQGNKIVYFDAGSGAKKEVDSTLIANVKNALNSVVIVGGGVRSLEQIDQLSQAGTNVIVIGNKIEEELDFLLDIHSYKSLK